MQQRYCTKVLQGCATFRVYQQKAATENARKNKPVNTKVMIRKRYFCTAPS